MSPEAEATIKRMKESKALRGTRSLAFMRERQRTSPFSQLPPDAKKEIYYVGEIEVERITVPASRPDAILLYVHGGGFRNGYAHNCSFCAPLIARETGMTIIAMNYRLAPENPYPAALEDCVKVYLDLLEKGMNPGVSCVLGTSAGGNLALAMTLYLKDHGYALPSSVIVNSPHVDSSIVPTNEEIEEDVMLTYDPEGKIDNEYFYTAEKNDPYAYPLCGDYSSFPPTLILVARKEILHQHSILLGEKLKQYGVDYRLEIDEELWHAFLNFPIPENIKWIKRCIEFMKEKEVR